MMLNRGNEAIMDTTFLSLMATPIAGLRSRSHTTASSVLASVNAMLMLYILASWLCHTAYGLTDSKSAPVIATRHHRSQSSK